MLKYENDCVCCDLPCINCGLKRNPHYYCDVCGEEIYDEMFEIDGYEMCERCHELYTENVTN